MNTKSMVTIMLVLAVIVVTAVIGILLLNRPAPEEAVPAIAPVREVVSGTGRGTVVTSDNVDELYAQASQPIPDAYYRTRMNVDWVFPNGKTESTNAYVENATSNERTVYFDVNLADTGELVYSSPFIPVGETLERFKLDAELPKGNYSGVCTYHLVDDNHEEITTVAVSVTLEVQA